MNEIMVELSALCQKKKKKEDWITFQVQRFMYYSLSLFMK